MSISDDAHIIVDVMCPILSIHPGSPFMDCRKCCGIFDSERNCCSFNTKSKVINVDSLGLKNRLKFAVDKLLSEKTGWGRVELKQKLYDLIDGMENESSL